MQVASKKRFNRYFFNIRYNTLHVTESPEHRTNRIVDFTSIFVFDFLAFFYEQQKIVNVFFSIGALLLTTDLLIKLFQTLFEFLFCFFFTVTTKDARRLAHQVQKTLGVNIRFQHFSVFVFTILEINYEKRIFIFYYSFKQSKLLKIFFLVFPNQASFLRTLLVITLYNLTK